MTPVATRTIHVVQGEHAVSHEADVVLVTVLGSCVAACLFDPDSKVGGMNHFLLPDGPDPSDIRYASAAMERLVNSLLKKGAARQRLRAKLFGGARMLAGLPDIGDRNARAALAFLESEAIPCVAAHLGGTRARRIRFWPASGRAEMQLVEAPAPIVEDRIRSLPWGGSVELFADHARRR
ncbi:MAG: chemotaxis protein CheD [Dehalococcoidia bacterium]|nr:chemotaxis protein CheD [Dehalococcoidia bacterium]